MFSSSTNSMPRITWSPLGRTRCEIEDVSPLLEATNKEIILDCSELDYISSSGLRIFLGIRKEAANHGSKVVVRNISTDIRQVFMMTGFISLFEIQ